MRANHTYGIKRDLERYSAICRAMLASGKIDQLTFNRQIDAVAVVEMAIPMTPYDRWEWTPAARTNLEKIRKHLASHAA